MTLAMWRYIAVAHPQKNSQWCGMKPTLIAIATGYILCPIICIPFYLDVRIRERSDGKKPIPGQYIVLPDYDPMKMQIKLIVYSVIIKLLPCICLTILSSFLIMALMEAKERRRQLTTSSGRSQRAADQERQTDRTTRMLLAVLLLFLITEFPQAIIGVLCLIFGQGFFITCYVPLGELMDIFALINSAINFILYCTMSRQFRSTFRLVFWHIFHAWTPRRCRQPNVEGESTGVSLRGGEAGDTLAEGQGKVNRNGTTNNMTQVTQV